MRGVWEGTANCELVRARWNGSKETVESVLNLDILYLQREVFFKVAAGVLSEIQWTTNGKLCSSVGYVLEKREGIPVSMQLQYKITNGDQRSPGYWVAITSTSCNYGGVRFWFLCPGWKNGTPCRRRCRKLYLRGDVFACRVCHELTYESTQKSGSLIYELIERPFKIRDRTVTTLKYLRAGRKRDRALRQMAWAERVIKLGFQRLPDAAEILGPLWAWENDARLGQGVRTKEDKDLTDALAKRVRVARRQRGQ